MSPPLAEINVIPLVDVMLVLLIIFMVAAPMLQRGLEVNLPVAHPFAGNRRASGCSCTLPLSFRSDRRVPGRGADPARGVFAERMRQTMLNRSDKPQVFLRGDDGVQLQEITEVMDRLKAGGVERVGILTQPGTTRSR